jgi:hypothetical protein
MSLQVNCGSPMRRLATLPRKAQRACEAHVRRAIEAFSPEQRTYRPEVLFCVANRP